MCPQSPPLSVLPTYRPYPSPRSKSPTSITQFKGSRKLPTLKYPLTDITNFTLAQATFQLSNLTPTPENDERLIAQAQELLGGAIPRKNRGKSRRGRLRAVRERDIGGAGSGNAVLRSPIPLSSSPRPSSHPVFNLRVAKRKSLPSSPIFSNIPSHKSPNSTNNTLSRTPHRRFPSVSAITPDTPRQACKRKKRWSSTSPRGNSVSPLSPSSPTLSARRPRHSYDGPPMTRSMHQVPPLSFPVPPPAFARCASHVDAGQQFSPLPAMNSGPGLPQAKGRKKRTKRQLAEIQWQITVHKSLAWRTTRGHLMKSQRQDVCEKCTRAEADPHLAMMDLAQGGLRIAFERPPCTCAGRDEPRESWKDAQMHWTDSLDCDLVKRLWVKLIAQGCRTAPVAPAYHRPQETPTPFPTTDHSQGGIPFPSEQSEQQLAPAIQLSSASCPGSSDQMGPGITPRRRVSAMTFASQTRPPVSLPAQLLSSPQPHATATVPISSFTAERTLASSQCQVSWNSAPTPRGTLTPAQLTAQAILRHGDGRSKPMRRGRPPGILPRASSLRHVVAVGYAD